MSPVEGRPITVAIVGHGKSPEGRGWGPKIDAADYVVRMWNWQWQGEADYGVKYDFGLIENCPSIISQFHKYNVRQPVRGWVVSDLGPYKRGLPPEAEIINQKPWTDIGTAMGGVGATKHLQFTRGTVVACWAIEHAQPGDEVVLVGFDNVYCGTALAVKDGFSDAYVADPSGLSFVGYAPGRRYGNHDFGIERPVMQHLADERGVKLTFSQDAWGGGKAAPLSALILGDAKCVYDDADAALELFTPDIVAATSNIGSTWDGRVDHWFTLHPAPCTDWVGIEEATRRRILDKRNLPVIWSYKAARGIDRVTTPDWAGASGLLAVKGMRELGCAKIVLAGVPMTKGGGHYYDQKEWMQAEHYHKGWMNHLQEIAPFVRSMSGWTRELLGLPDPSWLAK